MPEVYSDHFQNTSEAKQYETSEYARTSYSNLLWEIEQSQLEEIIGELRKTHPRIEALDFASGTGRITSFVESRVDSSKGIEISPEMCQLARGKVQKAEIICADILSVGAVVEGKYDLITAFRFFLNTEDSLRRTALRALAARLRDKQSVLVFNNHGNLWSHKLLLWPLHFVRRLGKGRQVAGNYLRTSEMRRLLKETGLELVSVRGCGVYSAKILKLMSYEKALAKEKRATGGALARFGVNQMYVVKLRD